MKSVYSLLCDGLFTVYSSNCNRSFTTFGHGVKADVAGSKTKYPEFQLFDAEHPTLPNVNGVLDCYFKPGTSLNVNAHKMLTIDPYYPSQVFSPQHCIAHTLNGIVEGDMTNQLGALLRAICDEAGTLHSVVLDIFAVSFAT